MKDLLATNNVIELKKAKESYDLVSAKKLILSKLCPNYKTPYNKSETSLDLVNHKQESNFAKFDEVSLNLLPEHCSKYIEVNVKDSQTLDENNFKQINFKDTTKQVANNSPEVLEPEIFPEEVKKTIQNSFDIISTISSLQVLVPAPDMEFEL
jgi:hypothetical protein